jgi:hypothetical protein
MAGLCTPRHGICVWRGEVALVILPRATFHVEAEGSMDHARARAAHSRINGEEAYTGGISLPMNRKDP